ncbi:MAG: hypothetical protein KAR42_03220 [candidate division Zixibacteria bacterium]|nr:hypothetical protein [candidate division Zixibacteria bacterium]
MKTVLALTIILLFCTAMLVAEIPSPIPYQGRLTDDTGAPVADGTYELTFSIYEGKANGTPLWTAPSRSVNVAAGLFTFDLGYSPSFPDGLFEDSVRYLGITVGSDAEIAPRTRLQSVPYAYQALRADEVANEDQFVHTAGDTMVGSLVFDPDNDGVYEGRFAANSTASNIYLRSNDTTTVFLFGELFGQLLLNDAYDGLRRVSLSAFNSGGAFVLKNSDNSKQIIFNSGYDGDESVMLPDDAINSDEILDEVGFASNTQSDFVVITSTAAMQDVVTVTITPPAVGYLFISAQYFVRLYNTTDYNSCFIQIDATAGGSLVSGAYSLAGLNGSASTADNFFPSYSSRMYYVAGSTPLTFRLEARKSLMANGDISIRNATITALYIPTSYGSVKTIVSDPLGFTDTKLISHDDEGNVHTAYEVDLRELELKAKEAKIKALEAQIELDNAREMLENRNRE